MKVFCAILSLLWLVAPLNASASDRLESRVLSSFDGAPVEQTLTRGAPLAALEFTLPPNAHVRGVSMTLAAAPLAFEPQPGLRVFANGKPAITLDPLPQAFSAQFALPAGLLNPGRNTIRVELAEGGDADRIGWTLAFDRSRLEVDLVAPYPDSPESLRRWLAADFGAPRGALVPALGDGQAALAVDWAQSLGRLAASDLRFTAEEKYADLRFIAQIDPRLTQSRLDVSGGAAASVTLVAPSLDAARERLHSAFGSSPEPDIDPSALTDLSVLAEDQLGRQGYSLVLPAGAEDQAAALTLIKRLAEGGDSLAPDWVGFDAMAAPANRDLAVLAPRQTIPEQLTASGPESFQASLRGDRQPAPNWGVRYGSMAQAKRVESGVAARFAIPGETDAYALILTNAAGSPFTGAMEPLLSSGMRGAMIGRVAIWRGDSVMIMDRGPFQAPGLIGMLRPSQADLIRTLGALISAFGLAGLLVMNRWTRKRKFELKLHRP